MLGNHEFDDGPGTAGTLVGNLTELGIPVVSCNIDASAEPALAGQLQRYALVPLPRSNVTVGVVGLTTTSTAYNSKPGAAAAGGAGPGLPRGWGPANVAATGRHGAFWRPCTEHAPATPLSLPHPGPNVRFLQPNETLPACVAEARAAGAEVRPSLL